MKPNWAGWLAIGAMTLSGAACAADVELADAGSWTLGPSGGIDATLSQEGGAAKVAFAKTGDERRLVSLEGRPGALGAPRSLKLRYTLSADAASEPQWALVIFERDGGVWYKVAGAAEPAAEPSERVLPIKSLQPAAFGRDPDGTLDWNAVERVWLGVVLDGPGTGTLAIHRAALSDEVYRPTAPMTVDLGTKGQWAVGKDSRVEATLDTADVDGGRELRITFNFPGGAHMYLTPGMALSNVDLDGYRGLRLTYKASLPAGIAGLLVTVAERDGSQYLVNPAPPASDDWTTVEIPFEQLQFATWTKDENEQLDLGQVDRIYVGTHGTAQPPGGDGTITVKEIAFVP